MQGAGITSIGGPVEILDLKAPREIAATDVVIDVHAAGVGNWDDLVRTGSWRVGGPPPNALGVEAAGTITAAGDGVTAFARGGAAEALQSVAAGGRLATITTDPPQAERDVTVASVYVRPNGVQLTILAEQLGSGGLTLEIASVHSLHDAARALAAAVAGHAGGAIVISLRE